MKPEDVEELLQRSYVSGRVRQQIVAEMTRLYRDLNVAHIVIGRFMAESNAEIIERVTGLKVEQTA